MYNFKL